MKKILLTAFIALVFSCGFASTGAESTTNDVKGSKKNYPFLIPVKFNICNDFVKATFVSDNVINEAYYNHQGELVGTCKPASINSLPETAKAAVVAQFPGYLIKEALQFSGVEETALFVSIENEKQLLVLKVKGETVEVFETTNRK